MINVLLACTLSTRYSKVSIMVKAYISFCRFLVSRRLRGFPQILSDNFVGKQNYQTNPAERQEVLRKSAQSAGDKLCRVTK